MLIVTPEKRKAIQSKGSTRAFSHQIHRSVLFVSLVTQVPSSSRPKQESRRHACTAAYARSKANNWYQSLDDLRSTMTDSDAESVKSGKGGAKANKNGDKVKKGGKSATSGGGMGGANV